MKNILTFLSVFLLLIACRDDDFGKNGAGSLLQPVNFDVIAKYEKDNNKLAKNATVVITNASSGDSYSLQTNDNGIAKFQNIIPGNYKINISKKMSSSEYQSTFSTPLQVDEINFNGSQEGVVVNLNVLSTSIELKEAKVGDLLIKQIYYAGSHATQGASFRDQFIEIYNNSNQVLYADGLYIAQLYGKANTTIANYTLANGQFDWSKSLDMTMGNTANTDYVYADYVIKIPGNGTDYPIQPGESVVIAQNGVNHKSPLVDNTGNPINVQNPALTVDLSTADFETYLGDFKLSIGDTVYKFDIQNPAVKDMQIAYWGKSGFWSGNNDFLMDNLGRDSFAIFKTDDFATFKNYADPSISVISSNTKFFIQIPANIIIDGVDLQHYSATSQRPKMLPASIDASFINCDNSFNSQAVIRKTKMTINNRIVLEDSNNSANDFIKKTANPRGFQ